MIKHTIPITIPKLIIIIQMLTMNSPNLIIYYRNFKMSTLNEKMLFPNLIIYYPFLI